MALGPWRRRLWWAGGGAVATCLVGLLPFLILRVPAARNALAQRAVRYANTQTDYRLSVSRVDRLDPWGIDLHDIRLRDVKGSLALEVGHLTVRLEPWSLLRGELVISKVAVRRVRGTFRNASPSKEAEKSDEPASEAFPIHVHALSVRDATVQTFELGPVVKVQIGQLEAAGAWGQHPWAYVSRAELAVDGREGPLLRLATQQSHWDAKGGGSVHLTGSLVRAPLEIRARIEPLRAAEPWPRGHAELVLVSLAPAAWPALGAAGAEVRDDLSVTLALSSQGVQAELQLKLEVGATRAAVHAVASSERVVADLDLASPDLRAVSGLLPQLSVAGHLRAEYSYTNEPAQLDLSWREVVVDGSEVPRGRLIAALAWPQVRVSALTLDGLGDTLQAEGVWDTQLAQGSAELALNELELSRVPLAALQSVAGRVGGRLGVSLSADGALSGRSDLSLAQLRVESLRVRAAQLELELTGTTAQPELDLKLRADGLEVAGTQLSRLTVHGTAGPSAARATLTIRAAEGWLVSELEAHGLSAELLEVQASGRGEARGMPIRFGLQGNHVIASGRTALGAQLSSRDDRLLATASLNGKGRGRAQLDLRMPALSAWAGAVGVEGLAGRLEAQLLLEGPLAQPDVKLDVQADAVRVPRAPPLYGTLHAVGSLARGDVQGQARVWSERKDAHADLKVSMHIPTVRGSLDFAGASQTSALGAQLPVAYVTAFAGPRFEGIAGVVKLDAEAHGSLSNPQADIVIGTSVTLPGHPDLKPESLSIALHLDAAEAALRATAADLEGDLLTLVGEVTWPNEDMPATLAAMGPESWPPFKLHARLAPRRLDTMQGVVAFLAGSYELELPVVASAEVSLTGDGKALNGSVRGSLSVHNDRLDPQCTRAAQSDVQLAVDLKGEELEAHMLARTSAGGSVDASLRTRLLTERMGTSASMLGAVALSARGRGIVLSELPGLCDLEAGIAAFNLSAKGFGGTPMEAMLELGFDGVKAPYGGALGAELTAVMNQQGLRAEAELTVEGKRAGDLEARIPLSFGAEDSLPTLPFDQALHARLNFKALPLGPLMSFGEGFGRPRGTASGWLRLAGTLQAPEPEALIELEDVAFSIASIAQPFRDIDGRVSLRGRTLRIQALTARDRGGKLRLDGEASLKPDGSGVGELRVKAEEFPLRRQGEVVGELTTQIRVRGAIDAQQRLTTDVRVDGGRLWLTGDRGKKVQSLSEHKEIRFVDLPQPVATAKDKARVAVTLASLVAKTQKSLWVMHRDFTVQVGLDLTLTRDTAFSMKGTATLERGNLELLGKSFRIEQGAITFTGDFPPDPEIELHAVYETPTGDDLRVSITGRGSAPVIAFGGAASTAVEAMALLSGSGRAGASSRAQTDARNFAAGLTAGLLSVTIREEFGEWVPIIAIENDASGAPTRGRAGFDAGKLIPQCLQGVARGAYVEGIVGSSDPGGSRVGLGARLEIFLPHDFVTSTGYGPGPTWGADLMWAP